jgi:protein-disulfide isomerase
MQPVLGAAQPLQAPPAPAKSVARTTATLPGIGVTQTGPETAPITVVEFSDFECPFCAMLSSMLKQLLDEYPDQIRLVFKHSPLRIHPNAPLAHEAAIAAGLQGKFWEMHDLLFLNQKRFSRNDLIGYAKQLNLDVTAFTAALTDRRFKPIVDQDLIESRGFGVEATPTFFINGRRYVGAPTLAELKAVVDEAIAPPGESAAETRVEHINDAGAPAQGAAESQVTIVEFSDLQCPFCAQAVPVMQQVMAAYRGKIKWVFKNFPLGIHPDAMLAHQAALAAAEQDRFWPMHDALMANQRAVKRDDLIAKARQLGLDVARFTSDLDDPRFRSRIETDIKEGDGLGVSSTPTFFINGRRLVGARPLEDFKALIEEELGGPIPSGEAGAARGGADIVGSNGTTAEPSAEIAGPNGSAGELSREAAGPDVGRGESNAPITMLWFSDFRSALTPKAGALVKQLTDAYPGQIRVEVKHRPLETRPESRLVHEAAVAAAAQGKFWEMQDLILAEPAGLLGRDRLIDLARRLGLDEAEFVKDLDEGTYRVNVERDLDEAQRRAVRGTPVFFVNGQRVDGVQPLSYFKRIVDEELRRRTDK